MGHTPVTRIGKRNLYKWLVSGIWIPERLLRTFDYYGRRHKEFWQSEPLTLLF
jgi:hypothetical protein